MDIVSTVDSLATRLCQLRNKYKNWITNPKQWDDLQEQCTTFSNHWNNIKIKLEDCKTIQSDTRKMLEDCMKRARCDLEETNREIEKLGKYLSTTYSQTNLSDEIEHRNNYCYLPTASGSTGRTYGIIKRSNQALKKDVNQLIQNPMSVTRITRDTATLQSISENIDRAIKCLLQVLPFVDSKENNSLKQDFHSHHAMPVTYDKWVVNFSSSCSCYMLTDSGSGSVSDCGCLTQEGLMKRKLLALHPERNDANSADNQHILPTTDYSSHVRSLCVYGNGGMGKTVALSSICYDNDVKRKFKDGIHFLTFGEDASVQDAIKQIIKCIRNAGYNDLANELNSSDDITDVAERCSKVFEGKRVLFIFDDLWITTSNKTGFRQEGMTLASRTNRGAVLYSTRHRRCANEATSEVHFVALNATGQESRNILNKHIQKAEDIFEKLDKKSKRALHEILELCGGWKLCLAIAGGALRCDIKDCEPNVGLGIRNYAETLKKDIEELLYENTEMYKEEQNLFTIAKSSIRQCQQWGNKKAVQNMAGRGYSIEEMLRSLCVLEKQNWTPVSVLYKMWAVDKKYGDALIKQASDLNFVSRKCSIKENGEKRRGKEMEEKNDEEGEWVIKMHDLLIDVCMFICNDKDGGVKKWHSRLLDSYITQNEETVGDEYKKNNGMEIETIDHLKKLPKCREWWNENNVNDSYIMKNVSRHLVNSGLWKELYTLITDVRWTMRRRVDGGWGMLREDMRHLKESIEKERRNDGQELISGIKVIENIIRDSWIPISEGEHQIGFEVFEKATSEDREHAAVSRYLNSIENYGPKPWLRPIAVGIRRVDGRQEERISISGDGYRSCLSKDIKYLVSLSISNGEMCIMDTELQSTTRFEIFVNSEEAKNVSCIDFCSQCWLVVIGFETGEIQIRDARTGMRKGPLLVGHTDALRCVMISIDGNRVISGSADKTITIWDVKTGLPIGQPLVGHEGEITCVGLDGDGKRVASGSTDRTVRIWDIETGLSLGQPLIGHKGEVTCVEFNDNGKRIASGSTDKTLRLWNIEKSNPVGQPLVGHEGKITCVGFNRNGKRIASGSTDKTVRIWDTETDTPAGQPLIGHEGEIRFVKFNDDGKRLASEATDKAVRIWDIETDTPAGQPLIGHEGEVTYIGFSVDGNRVVSGSRDNTIRMWDIWSSKQIGDTFEVGSSFTGKVESGNYLEVKYRQWLQRQEKVLSREYPSHSKITKNILHEDISPALQEMKVPLKVCDSDDQRRTNETDTEKNEDILVQNEGVWYKKDKYIKLGTMRAKSCDTRGNFTLHGCKNGRVMICRIEE